jgi:quinol monooxygenase YgiN
MAGFIQLIEYETNDVEAVQKAILKFREEHPGVMTFTTSRVAEDRDKPGTYISIVEFPSYEEAMKQSNHPALSEFVQSMGPELMTNQRFRNLDVKATV